MVDGSLLAQTEIIAFTGRLALREALFLAPSLWPISFLVSFKLGWGKN